MKSSRICRVLGRAGAGLVLASGCSGCSGVDATCSPEDMYDPASESLHVEGPALPGEVILSRDETSASTAFEVVLADLPEVWVGEEPLRQPTLAVSFELEYPDQQPPGAELPPITAVLDTGRRSTSPWDAAQATITLGGPQGATGAGGVAPFVVCSSNSMRDCCPYGSSSCSGGARLLLTREADLFPRVRIRYTAVPSAQLYSCLEDEPRATWTLQEAEE
ncbi:MAG TPA: hypothetical protein VFU02_21285 [Polyangiaceae bacterium]|nr:hypothetical protein [Polyangiaceae bacterium]